MIKKISVTNLNGSLTKEIEFHKDLNIFTGKNGSGKTNLLKMIWYLISGNIEFAISEVDFEDVLLETDEYKLSIKNHILDGRKKSQISFTANEANESKQKDFDPSKEDDTVDEMNQLVVEKIKSSIFFPSFRRIEGSFAEKESTRYRLRSRSKVYDGLRNSMKEFADRLSVYDHKFISSISTDDIKEYTFQTLAKISESTDEKSQEYFSFIIKLIEEDKDTPKKIISKIKSKIENYNEVRDIIREPFLQMFSLVTEVFKYKGVKFSESVIFGDDKNAINSDRLSSGEKQMLSFLCYGSFYSNCPIFIDEPELSLHVDWQRSLFDILLKSNSNQYIISTHSPFIYSQYPDKEFQISSDRG